MDIESTTRPGRKRSLRTLALAMLTATIVGLAYLLLLGSVGSDNAPDGRHTIKQDVNITSYGTDLTARSDWEDLTPLGKLEVKGNWLACMMNMQPEHVTPQAPFSLWSELAENGWASSDGPYVDREEIDEQGYTIALTHLIGTAGMYYTRWMISEHVHKATQGEYDNHYNQQDGVIIAKWNYGPAYQKKEYRLTADVPNLNQWSDIVYIDWLHFGGTTNLQHIVRSNIVNQETKDTVDMVAKDAGLRGPLPVWPGWQFPIKSKHAKVLIATPHGAGVAYFLSQHKRRLGIKVTSVVGAFLCNPADKHGGDNDQMCMYFGIANGPLPADQI